MYRANELKRLSYDYRSATQHTLHREDVLDRDQQRAQDHDERLLLGAGNSTSSATFGTFMLSNSSLGLVSTASPARILDRRPIVVPDHVVIACPRRMHPSAHAFRNDPSDKQEKINRYLDELEALAIEIDDELRGFYKVLPNGLVAPWRLSHNGGSSLRWGFRTGETQPLEDLTAVSGGLLVLLRNGTEYWEPGFGGTIEAGHTVCPMSPLGSSEPVDTSHRDTSPRHIPPVADRPWGENVSDHPNSAPKRSVSASYGPPYGELPDHWMEGLIDSTRSHPRADGDDLCRRDSFGETSYAHEGLIHPQEDDYELAQLSLDLSKPGQTRDEEEEGELEQMYRREHLLTGIAAATVALPPSSSGGSGGVGYEADNESLPGIPFDQESFSDPAVPGLNLDWVFPMEPCTRIYEDPVKHDQGEFAASDYDDLSVSPLTSVPDLRYVEKARTTWPRLLSRQEASNEFVVDMSESAEQAREGAGRRPKYVSFILSFIKSIGIGLINCGFELFRHRPQGRSFGVRRAGRADPSTC